MATVNFDPTNVDLTTANPTEVICFLQASQNAYNGNLGARISALFVILIISSAATVFPVITGQSKRFKIPVYIYLFARYFGAGVIIATAFIHLMDPAYREIGPNTCVGMTGNWSVYSWPPAIILASVVAMFLLDFGAERYVEIKYGTEQNPVSAEAVVTAGSSGNQSDQVETKLEQGQRESASRSNDADLKADRSFRQQIAAFLILEFGVIFHSVIIGLNLGTSGPEFSTLYPVIVFHQCFEGLGIGARMSAIPFPQRFSWLPWALCAAYGLTTPISIAIGLGLRTTYNSGSFTANTVSGTFDSLSAGILIYTGLVELLARDFLFNPERTMDNRRLTFMIICLLVGAGVMALLGKWA
ncbi:hypothetical protein Egran_05936 [Elaphomyces granulatus]|uniref:Uncharacterized protein n=1 Tax=Elaphomyces granulatus TaxID=519963 RepID=A0A232LQ46_9EURO|nr:hypothetical protein Egran_05936 [Elaphomyces granulatus]